MGGIAGFWNFDRQPLDRTVLDRMRTTIEHRGPDGLASWVSGPIGMTHATFYTTPESCNEVQPWTDESRALCLTLDGRVDNREELADELEAAGTHLRCDTDAELVLRAYQCWGEHCPAKIIGDFAFVVWDSRLQQVFCARDVAGIKPFYYFTNASVFVWGSDLNVVLQHPAVPRKPNEGMIAEYLAVKITSCEETLYQDVFRLPPAHSLIVQGGNIVKRRYWDVDAVHEFSYSSDEQYQEHFLEIFSKAVTCALRSSHPVGISFSGGVDSSLLLGVAASLRSRGLASYDCIEALSLIFPGKNCDESEYISDVTAKWQMQAHLVHPSSWDRDEYAKNVRKYLDFGDYPNGTMGDSLRIVAREKKIRVMLAGHGGDEWFAGSNYHYADLLRGFRMKELLHRAKRDREQRGNFQALKSLAVCGFWPWVPESFKPIVRWATGQPRWLNPEFVRRTSLSERVRLRFQRSSSFTTQSLQSLLYGGNNAHGMELDDRNGARFGVEQRCPFLDRRVVEFGIGLPEAQRYRDGQSKFLLRQAAKDLLPEHTRNRATKAEFSHTVVDALRAEGGEQCYRSLLTASVGWVDGGEAAKMYQKMQSLYESGSPGYTSYTWPLWMIHGVDSWYKAVFGLSPEKVNAN